MRSRMRMVSFTPASPHVTPSVSRGPSRGTSRRWIRSGQTARRRDGLGLGLYIASRIAAEHGAELTYGYEAPHVVFTLCIPALD